MAREGAGSDVTNHEGVDTADPKDPFAPALVLALVGTPDDFSTPSSMPSTPYSFARESYAAAGIDSEAVLTTLECTPISLHCWQGDDVGGFEKPNAVLSGGGIQATGNYPG